MRILHCSLQIGLRCGIVWMTFYTVGLCFGASCKKAFKPKVLSLLIALAVYGCGVLCELSPLFSYLSYGAIYHAALPETMVFGNLAFDWLFLPAPIVFQLLFTVCGAWAFKRRDIPEEIGV